MAELAAQTQSAGEAPRPAVGGYRPDIDGLRAIAVILVVLWHAGVRGIPGGYAGVDVFFVISGYVITGSLLRDAARRGDQISILGFYARRLRRIAPAFLVMLAVVLAASFVIALPSELTRTASVALGGLALAANVVLWREGGYFGHGADTEPLRHVWSLSIEEQFYLVYPALLALLLARAPRAASAALAALAALSLAGFLLLIRDSPEAAFDLGPTRAWELMIGCLCALQAKNWRAPRLADQALTLAGAALIAAAALELGRSEASTVLFASLGAALLVFCGERRGLVGRLLAGPPLRIVGLASYSLYLWHWPLLALARSLRPAGLGAGETVLLLAAATVLGFASWRFIEQPLRRPWADARARARFFAICGSLAAFSLAGSAVALAGGGWPGRFPPAVAALASYEDFNLKPGWETQFHRRCFSTRVSLSDYDADACFTADPARRNVLLWGDSHAAELASALTVVAVRDGAHLMQATMGNCVPSSGAGLAARGCSRFDALVRARLQRERADVVLLAFSAYRRTPGLWEEIDALTRSGARVIVVGPTPAYTTFVAPLLARAWPTTPDMTAWRRPLPFALDPLLEAAAAGRPGVRYVSALRLMCPARRCDLVTKSGVPVIWDRDHMTPDAADELVARAIAGPLAEALRAPPPSPAAAKVTAATARRARWPG